MKAALLVSTLITTLALASTASAGHKRQQNNHQNFFDSARVMKVVPIIHRVRVSTPRRQCWQEEVQYPVTKVHGVDTSKVLLGTIIGGAIGRQFGSGHGKDAATIAGTLIGASIGHNEAIKSAHVTKHQQTNYVQRCRINNSYTTKERIDGYNVTYRYRKQIFNTRLPNHPGKWLQVRVNVKPVMN